MSFRTHEIEYLQAADLGRLATIAPDGTVQNSPVGFSYNAELGTIDIVGYHMSKSRKFRNLKSNKNVAFVVDDIASRDPWRVRCLWVSRVAGQFAAPPNKLISVKPRPNRMAIRWTPRSSGFTQSGSSASASTTPDRIYLKADSRDVGA